MSKQYPSVEILKRVVGPEQVMSWWTLRVDRSPQTAWTVKVLQRSVVEDGDESERLTAFSCVPLGEQEEMRSGKKRDEVEALAVEAVRLRIDEAQGV